MPYNNVRILTKSVKRQVWKQMPTKNKKLPQNNHSNCIFLQSHMSQKTAFMCLVKNAPHSTFYVSEFPDGGNLFHRTAAMSRWPLNLASILWNNHTHFVQPFFLIFLSI